MPKSPESQPLTPRAEAAKPVERYTPTGEDFTDRLFMLRAVQERNPYADVALLRARAVEDLYDDMNREVGHLDTPLENYQQDVFAYMTVEINLHQTQSLVPAAVMSDKNILENAVRELCDRLVDARDDKIIEDPNADVNDMDHKIDHLTVTLNRLENDEQLPSGDELVSYVHAAEQAHAWRHQTLADIDSVPMVRLKEERWKRVKNAIDVMVCEAQTYNLLQQVLKQENEA